MEWKGKEEIEAGGDRNKMIEPSIAACDAIHNQLHFAATTTLFRFVFNGPSALLAHLKRLDTTPIC